MILTSAKNDNATYKLNWFAKKFTIGTPTTIPEETPINTLATAFGLTESDATEKAKAIYTGWNMAGIILATNNTVKLVVKSETILLIIKIMSTSNITLFLSTFESNRGIIGPEIAIPIAKMETSHPAVDILTLK